MTINFSIYSIHFCLDTTDLGPILTLVLLNPDMHCFCKQCWSRSVGFWSGSALFAIKYVTLYQQAESSNLIGWKSEWVWCLNLFSMTRVKPSHGQNCLIMNHPIKWLQCKRFLWRLRMSRLTLVLLNKLRFHAHFQFSANQITWSRLLI